MPQVLKKSCIKSRPSPGTRGLGLNSFQSCQPKTFLILYPFLENPTTGIAILPYLPPPQNCWNNSSVPAIDYTAGKEEQFQVIPLPSVPLLHNIVPHQKLTKRHDGSDDSLTFFFLLIFFSKSTRNTDATNHS